MLGSGELSALHSMRGKISRDSWRVGDCNHVRTTWLQVADNCTLRLQFMHRLFHHSVGYPGVPSREGTVEQVDPLKQCGSPAIVLWVCNPYSEGSDIP